MFRRGEAGDELREGLDRISWKTVKAPSAAEREILLGDGSRLGALKRAHAGAAGRNVAIVDQIEDEKRAAGEKRREREERRLAAVRARKQAEAERRERNRMAMAQRRDAKAPAQEVPVPVVNGPFDGLPGGSFINAVYKGDWDAVKTFNEAYGNRKIRQYKRSMGNRPHFADGLITAGYRSIELPKIMLAVYLFNYDSAYEGCLRDDAVTFEVVEHVPDTVYRNLLGYEVMRSHGYTSRERFRVNKEFTASFRRIGKMKPESAMGTIADFFLNQGGTDLKREMVKGTKAMMAKFSCGSPEIKQLERNLLRYMR
jgi:hypothetical protein